VPLAEDIIARVDKKFLDTRKLRDRMEDDYNKRWQLTKYTSEFLEGYETYTSNDSKTFARKGIAILNSALMSVRCPQNNDPREQREQDNAKEQFAIGNLKANDERLVRIGVGPLRRSMDFHMLIRGFTTGRCTLVKRGNRSWADATPWDPLEVAWEYGPDGLAWICRRWAILRSAAERDWQLPRAENPEEEVVTCYDYYDTIMNIVLLPDVQKEPVKNNPHGVLDGYGEPRVAGWCVANPMQPPIQAGNIHTGNIMDTNQLGDLMADYGESIFSENRETWDTHNFNMSIMKNLSGRSLKPVFGIRSANGTRLIEGDPFKSGAEIPLAQGEELIIYRMQESAPDLLPYQSIVDGEKQRGGFSVIMYGDAPLAISGVAMHTLKSGQGDKVLSGAIAIQLALKDITNIWCDQYITGAFGQGMELSGQGGNRKWFVANITPDMIRELPELVITLTPQFPEDDAGKVQMALALRQPGPTGLPVLGDYDIREDILERQNSDQDLDTILQEQAGMEPLVQAHRFVDALSKRGDEGAQYWQGRWMMLVSQAMQAGFLPMGIQNAPDMPGGNGGGGFSPNVLPNAAQGIPPPRPGIDTPNQVGPNVPPGTPRPGAQNGGGLRQGIPPLQ
jgi:hypothetical protein